jgi:hypothetical protein
MTFSEYVLLVSLAAGIHAQGEADGIVSIGPEVITQPNGGAVVRVAGKTDKGNSSNTAKTAEFGKWLPASPGPSGHLSNAPAIRPPAIRPPRVR